MKISELAKRTGTTIDTIRFYEKQGLFDNRHFQRGENNYRDYTQRAIEQMQMIQQARSAGFTLREIVELLTLWKRGQLGDDAILERLCEKQKQVAAKIGELEKLEAYLSHKIRDMT